MYGSGMATTKPMLILIAGPYRSGTNGDPAAMAANLARLEDAVLRPPGVSAGADQDVAIAESRGLPVYYGIADIPAVGAQVA